MSSAVQSLTEKEKQALRLLVTGYDAKSMAHHLGLSVHTVNERLREARRKLQVSSSREAARRLRAIEADFVPLRDPQFSGPEFLAGAPDCAAATHGAPPTGAGTAPFPVAWMIGAITMSILLAALAIAAFSDLPDTPAAAASASSAPAIETDAARAARAWLALVDAGDWRGSWDATSKVFRSLNTPGRWAQVAASVQLPLGAMIEHRLISSDFVPAPPAGYQLVKFRSQYANKANAVMTISLVEEDGRWKVSGILID